MANRSQLYVFNEKKSQMLSEGIYQIPAFWQCLWSHEEVLSSATFWSELFERDEEDIEEYLSQNILSVRIPIEASKRYAVSNRSFIMDCFPDALELYDQFVSFVFDNSKSYDYIGIDVTEILLMEDDETDFIDEMLGNLRAFNDKDISGLSGNIAINVAEPTMALGETQYYNPVVPFEQSVSSTIKNLKEKVEEDSEKEGSDSKHYIWILIVGLVLVLLRYIIG